MDVVASPVSEESSSHDEAVVDQKCSITEDNTVSAQSPAEESPKIPPGGYVYDKVFLLSLRESASQSALTNSNQENLKDITRKVRFF